MCGILGNISFGKNYFTLSKMSKILSSLNHRGPNKKKIIKLNNAYLGHTKLSIIGLKDKESNQPIVNKNYALLFNGEIYNYKSLCEKLNKNNIRVSGKSDTEVLFKCLENYGLKKTLKLIDGMFAFTLYDLKKNKIYLVRDKVGEKSIYFFKNKKYFWFSSEIKALCLSGLISKKFNLKKLSEFFYLGKIHGSDTFFKEVSEVEPGHFIELDIKTKKTRNFQYWKIENTFNKTKIFNTKNFKDHLVNAIRTRRISDVPIGTMLSGGVDSQSILYFLLDPKIIIENSKIFYTFTASNNNKELDETKDVKQFIKKIKKKRKDLEIKSFYTKKINIAKYIKSLEKLSYYNDEPLSMYMAPMLDNICYEAKKKNFKVLYSGEGADELFYGYERFVRTKKILKNKTNKDFILKNIFFGGGVDKVDVIKKVLLKKGEKNNQSKSDSWVWLEKNYKKYNLDDLQLLFSQKFRLQILLHRNDRVGMANSIEIRVPFLSPKLIEVINNYPINEKFNKKEKVTKYILKKALNSVLDKKLLKGKKKGFTSDFYSYLFDKRIKDCLLKLINKKNSFANLYLNIKEVKNIIDMHFSKRKDLHVLIWRFFSLEIWYNQINQKFFKRIN